ncbi:MAG: alpha/beta hydrolase [Actinomycetota bacterium]|nr:alpha/beta hydrolase [Actinomycetota bacterium]
MVLDPQFRAVLEAMASSDATALSAGTADDARRNYRALAMSRRRGDYRPETVAQVSDDRIDGPLGAVPVRLYRPDAVGDLPVVTYAHGGGWVLGDLETHDPVCRRMANQVGAIVVAVDYRLAPEHPHPAPLDDVMAALRWTAATFPGRPHGVAGDSAGASLVAGAALRAAHGPEGVDLVAQLLAYPAVDPAMGFPSIAANGEGFFLTAADIAWFWHQYLPTPEAAADLDVAVVHAPVPDGLAPAVVVTAEYDPLHDEGVAYAAHLSDAGVAVEHVEGFGLIHGFLAFLGVVDAAEVCGSTAMAAFARLLREGH